MDSDTTEQRRALCQYAGAGDIRAYQRDVLPDEQYCDLAGLDLY